MTESHEVVEYFSYAVYRFTAEQIIWLIENMPSFDKGEWPVEPNEYITDKYNKETKKWEKVRKLSSFTDEPIGALRVRPEAYFVKPTVILAEVNWRLERTKRAGEVLVHEINSGLNKYEFLSDYAKDALDYISGLRRRKLSFADWGADKKRRKNQ